MAHLDQISVGNYTKLFYDNGTAWAEVTEVNTLPAPSDEATVVTIPEYNRTYQRQLVGSRTAGNIELSLNWNPSNVSHVYLAGRFGNTSPTRFYIEYTDSAGSKSTFQDFQALVSGRSVASEFDAGRTLAATLVVANGLSDFSDTQPTY